MYTVENSKFNRESKMDTILHQRASSYCMPSGGGRQTLCTDEAERRQRFPDETRDLTLNVEYQSCAPQHAPVVQRIEQRGQESLRVSRRTRQFMAGAFRRRKADDVHRRSGTQSTVSGGNPRLDFNLRSRNIRPAQYAPVVQRIEQGFPKP